MEDRETARMRKYGESKTTRIMMATVPHTTSGLGLRKFQAVGFLLTRVYLLNRGQSRLWNQTGCFGEEKNLSSLLRIKPQFISCPVCRLVTILIVLSKLSTIMCLGLTG